MPKRITITTFDDIIIKASGNKATAIIEDAEINAMLSSMDKEDIISWVRNEGFAPDEVFSMDDLNKWAEDNGFVKE